MKTLSNYPQKMLLGYNDNQPIYLSAPSWDCGWYWGFGYIGNKDCHYHVSGLNEGRNQNMYDAFIEHFGSTLTVRRSQLWTLCELFETFYTLRKTAEVLGRGGSHYTTNPCKDLIINKDEVTRINNVVLPQIFEEIYKILIRNKDNKAIDKKLITLILKGDTSKVIKFMLEYAITTDDLKFIEGASSHDFNVIHSYYWDEFHRTKRLKR